MNGFMDLWIYGLLDEWIVALGEFQKSIHPFIQQSSKLVS
jgi:hypothetical protein